MNTPPDTVQPGHPFVAGFWLIAALPLCMMLIFPLYEILYLEDNFYIFPTIFIMFTAHFAMGYLWARSLGRRSGLTENGMMNISGGLGFALGVLGIIILFESSLKDFLDRWLALFKGVGNLEFGALFAPWTGFVSGVSGFALGLGLRDWKLALKLLVSGFLSGLVLYLAIMSTMELLGFKVGTGRPVMLPTTFMSMWSAALVGSAIFGKVLAKSKVNEQQMESFNPPEFSMTANHQEKST